MGKIGDKRSVFVKRLEEAVKGLNELTVLKLRLEGAILACDELAKDEEEHGTTRVPSGGDTDEGGASLPDDSGSE